MNSTNTPEITIIERDGVAVASIVRRGNYFDVFPAPDAPERFHGPDGITMDSFRTLEAAKEWVEKF